MGNFGCQGRFGNIWRYFYFHDFGWGLRGDTTCFWWIEARDVAKPHTTHRTASHYKESSSSKCPECKAATPVGRALLLHELVSFSPFFLQFLTPILWNKKIKEDLHFPPLYWMETLRFLALSGLDLENIYENAYFHILNSENWQEKNALKNLVLILVLPLPTCLAYSELSIPSRLSFLHFQNEWFGPDNWPSNCASEILLKVLGWQSPHSSYFPILSAIKIT